VILIALNERNALVSPYAARFDDAPLPSITAVPSTERVSRLVVFRTMPAASSTVNRDAFTPSLA